jgi:hypothetical protein
MRQEHTEDLRRAAADRPAEAERVRTPAGRLKSRHRKRDVGLRRRLVPHTAEVRRGRGRAGNRAGGQRPCRGRPAIEIAAMKPQCRPSPTARAARRESAPRPAPSRLSPVPRASASGDGAYGCPSGGFTRSRWDFGFRRGTRPQRTVRAGGLRVLVAANSFALPSPHGLGLPTRHPCNQRGAAAWRAAMASRRVWISSRLIQRPRAITPAMRCRLASSASGSASSSSRSARRPTATVPNASLR